MKKSGYKHTIVACFIAYAVQAVVCNFAPLLFVSWSNEFNISTLQITSVVTVTFVVQIIVDLLSAEFADKIGYKNCLVASHVFSAVGFLLLGILPYVMKNAYSGILICVILYSIGSGILEVLISPVVEACPTDNKTGAMSLLHSFYCWGTVAVIALSTAYFTIAGRDNWRYLSFFWAAFSLANGIFFCFVPIARLNGGNDGGKSGTPYKNIFFYAAVLLMICAGSAEQAMSQWVSSFAETGLGVDKTVGDLAGTMAFAVLMGSGRVLFGKLSKKVRTEKYLVLSAALCIVSYMLACLSPSNVLSLIGCALCGFAVSAMWPATISLTTVRLPGIGTAVFAFLAFAGDIGCTLGPSVTGWVTNAFDGEMKKGLAAAISFPVIIILTLFFIRRPHKKSN